MRLWHEKLLPYLPRQQLLGQHRECCALRGLGWGKPHSVVNYVFDHPYGWLVEYHRRVMWEMRKRLYNVDYTWIKMYYRGKRAPEIEPGLRELEFPHLREAILRDVVYPEHNDAYLKECLDNLAGKGIYIDMEEKK